MRRSSTSTCATDKWATIAVVGVTLLFWAIVILVIAGLLEGCATARAIYDAPPGAVEWLRSVGAALLDDLVSLLALFV